MNQLRDYQSKIISEVKEAFKQGYKAPCIVLSCGGGKSVIVADIAKKATLKGNRVLFLVHRKELCEQIENTFTNWGVNMDYCDVAMVQTVSRRLHNMPSEAYSLIIVDENHHSLANTYKKVFDHFKAKRIGITATPVRLNGDGLGDVNDLLIEGVDTNWLIENNFLAPFEYYAPRLVDTGKLHIQRGEFIQAEVDELLMENKIFGDAIEYYRKLAHKKQAIIYAHSVEASKAICKRFSEAGYKISHIDANTPEKERKELIKAFAEGELTLLTNVDLFGEGLDVPNCECVILLRPTMSLTLHIQQSMRAMRYKEGKTAIIIDHVGNVYRHGLPTDKHEWTLEKKKKRTQEQNILKVWECENCYRISNLKDVKNNICPLCGFQRKEIKRADKIEDTGVELMQIFTVLPEKKDLRTLQDFKAYARVKGYNPKWAYIAYKSRKHK